MDKVGLLALFLAVSGLGLILGPRWMMRRYQSRINRLNDADMIDDLARREGTVLFIVGGMVFLAAAAVLVFILIAKEY